MLTRTATGVADTIGALAGELVTELSADYVVAGVVVVILAQHRDAATGMALVSAAKHTALELPISRIFADAAVACRDRARLAGAEEEGD